MKIFKFLFITLTFFSEFSAQTLTFNFFPENKIYSRYYADAVSHQFSLNKHFESAEWFGNIGANVALGDLFIEQKQFQFSAGATVLNTVIKTPGHIQVYTVDYLVDFFLDSEITENFIGRFIFGHLSAHYSDDGIVQLNNDPISYVRDYFGLHFQNKFSLAENSSCKQEGKIYYGIFYNYHNEPVIDKHLTIQAGLDGGTSLSAEIFLFAAIDVKFKSEVNYGTTQSFQMGFIFPYSNRVNLRMAYTHRRGFEERGQLYNQKDIKNTIGVFIDF